ncbi:MAG: Dabb family protein [Gammaproteobacteria bacterium]|nr:MAG: Dabb family protein [Gammaproteobacteria bacterium]
MIKHIVIWTLKDEFSEDEARDACLKAKEILEDLNGKIDGMHELEVGIDFSKTEASGDFVLYSTFESKQALDAYQEDPLHLAVKPYIGSIRKTRQVIDYEI